MNPIFLSIAEVLETHRDQIDRRRQQTEGAVAALVFLSVNGIVLEADEDAFEKGVRSVAVCPLTPEIADSELIEDEEYASMAKKAADRVKL